jgi:hypothetical protein
MWCVCQLRRHDELARAASLAPEQSPPGAITGITANTMKPTAILRSPDPSEATPPNPPQTLPGPSEGKGLTLPAPPASPSDKAPPKATKTVLEGSRTEREAALEGEVAEREKTLKGREAKIAELEDAVKRLSTPPTPAKATEKEHWLKGTSFFDGDLD